MMKKKRFNPKYPIQIKSQAEVDEMAEEEISPSVVWECLAEIWPLSVSEKLENMRMEARATHGVRIRWLPGIIQEMVIKDVARGVDMEIKEISDNTNKFLIFITEELAP